MTIDEAIAHAQETADTRSDLCDECRNEHRQLADWLTEPKQLREENAELKRLLKLAVEDMKTITINVAFEGLVCGGECARFFECERVKNNDEKMYRCCKFEWKHAEEALKLLGDDDNGQ